MQLRTQKKQTARRIALYGQEGVGKTTLASLMPRPVFIDVEGSTEEMDVPAYDCTTIAEVRESLNRVKRSPDFGTVILDTIDWCEHAITAEMLDEYQVKGIEDIGGGFGKGYVYLGERMLEFLALLDDIRNAGKHVVLLGHSTVKKVTPPDAQEGYDHYEMKLSKKSAPIVKEWADALLFYRFDVKIRKDDKTKRVRAIGGKDRVLICQHNATADAKNRFGLPEEVDVITGATTLPKELAAVFEGRTVIAAPVVAKAGAVKAAAQNANNPNLARFVELFASSEEAKSNLTRFLMARGEITAGQGFEHLKPAYLARAIASAANFSAAVAEFIALENANADAATRDGEAPEAPEAPRAE